jgi:L-fucose isomerase
VHLYSEQWFYRTGGAAVHYLVAPGDVTLARLSRLDGACRKFGTVCRFLEMDLERLDV